MTAYLITGVSGYLGRKILGALAEKGNGQDRIIGVDIVEPSYKPDILEFYRMDVRDEAIRELAARERVEVVIHLAFVLNPIFNRARMHSIDVWGTDNVLRAAASCGARQLFVTSSASAYGALPDNPEPLTENHPLRAPRNYQYAYDKAKIDRMVRRFMKDRPEVAVAMVRPCIVLGPNVDNYISRGLALASRFLIGGNDPTMQFVHEDDVARAALMMIEQKTHGIYNLVGKDTMSLSQILELIRGKPPRLSLPAWLVYPAVDFMWQMGVLFEAPSGQLDFLRWPWWADGEKAKNEVGFEAEYTTRDSLLAFLEANGKK